MILQQLFDPLGRPKSTSGGDHYILTCPSVLTFQNQQKITAGQTVGWPSGSLMIPFLLIHSDDPTVTTCSDQLTFELYVSQRNKAWFYGFAMFINVTFLLFAINVFIYLVFGIHESGTNNS